MIVGVCGKYCAGKSFVAAFLQNNGFTHISVDALGHQALEVCRTQIIAYFGEDIVSPHTIDKKMHGIIDRKKLGGIVFSHKEKLHMLESITHPWIVKEIHNIIQSNPHTAYIIDAALLYYMNIHSLCTHIIIVHSPWIVRVFRAMKRDGISFSETQKRFKNQKAIPDKKYYKKIKKTLNKTQNCSEQLVNGLYSLSVLDKKLAPIIKGVKNGRTHISREPTRIS